MKLKHSLLAAAMALTCTLAGAQTIRIANQGDALSMDPHSLNESLQLSVNLLAGRCRHAFPQV